MTNWMEAVQNKEVELFVCVCVFMCFLHSIFVYRTYRHTLLFYCLRLPFQAEIDGKIYGFDSMNYRGNMSFFRGSFTKVEKCKTRHKIVQNCFCEERDRARERDLRGVGSFWFQLFIFLAATNFLVHCYKLHSPFHSLQSYKSDFPVALLWKVLRKESTRRLYIAKGAFKSEAIIFCHVSFSYSFTFFAFAGL